MFDKKIILLISFLLVTGSSYIIFHRKKDNNDEVNIVDNSDNSINNVLNEDNQEESSNSFLKYFFLFIIVIIIAVIAFFAVKKFVKKKQNKEKIIWDDDYSDEELEKNNENNKENIDPNEIFNEYIKAKEKLKNDIEELSAQKDMKKITDILINQIKKDYLKKEGEKSEPLDYSPDDCFLVDFYFGENVRDTENGGNIEDDEINKNKDIFFKNNKKVRDISLYRDNYRHIIVNLFITFFEEFATFEEFKENPSVLKDLADIEREFYIFMAVIIEPFLKYVSERKDVRFISAITTLDQNCGDFLAEILSIVKKEDIDFAVASGLKTPDLSSISLFFSQILYRFFDAFVVILDKLINQHFPESKELNEKENNK